MAAGASAEHGAPPGIRALAVVPARLGSRRLPRKMLLDETGACLFEHTVQNARRCGALERVVVATDSDEVLARARAADIEAVATRADHPSGTDRVNEALGRLDGAWDVVVNVQGDEPELDPTDLARLVAAFADPEVEVATLSGPLADAAEHEAAAVVKVVCDARGDALYFSRSPIPHLPRPGGLAHSRDDADPGLGVCRRHVGVYAFRPAALAAFCALEPGALERVENLEQLRWLEAGRSIRVLETSHVPLGIDTRADYDAFVERVAARPRVGVEGRTGG
jgi:3-deoxy-manno-octulosonate cytidylyltransferase (CMP-KDO synthetase)